MTGGVLQFNNYQNSIRVGEQSTAGAFQTGGTNYLAAGNSLIIGDFNGAAPQNANGLYYISGGLLSTTGGAFPGSRIQLNRNNKFSPLPQATLSILDWATINLGQTIETIKAANVLTTASLQFGPAGNNILSVTGPNATINMDSLVMQANTPSSGPATGNRIQFTFDQNGPSLIHINGNYTAAQVQAIGGANCILRAGYLSVNYTYGPLTNGTTFNLLTADKIFVDPTQPFVADPSLAGTWSMAVVGTGVMGDGLLDTLQVAYAGPSTFVGSPPLTIANADNNQVIVSWSPLASGWTLQTNTDLATGNWDYYTGPVVNNSVTNSPLTGNVFFRLIQ